MSTIIQETELINFQEDFIMKQYIEVRWHGRGGQGTVTGAKMLASSVLSTGMYIQAFPEYGPERRGAPLKAFNRFSKNRITLHTPVKHPDVVIIVDNTLIGRNDIVSGIKENTVFLVNTKDSPEDIQKKLGTENKIFTLAANQIALDTIGRAIPNGPMLGLFVKATGLVELNEVIKAAEKTFRGRFSDKIVEGNIKSIERGYKEAKENV